MADPVVPDIIKRVYGERLTLDLDTPLPLTLPGGCLSLKNVIRRNGRSLAKRPGIKMVCSNEYQGASSDIVHCALLTHAYADSADGVTEDLYSFGSYHDSLALLPIVETGEIEVNYTGLGTASISILANASGQWEVTLYVDDVAVSGWPNTYDEGLTPISGSRSIEQLVLDIDAEANWAASDASTSNPRSGIAQIGSLPQTDLVPADTPDLTIPYSLTDTPFTLTWGATGGPTLDGLNHENIKGLSAQNCFYVAVDKRTPVLKFDGQAIYKPGLPKAIIVSVADTGSGATHAAGNVYLYRIGFWRVDNKDNQIYGPYSEVVSHTVGGAPTDVTLTFNNLSDNSASTVYDEPNYFSPRSATVNGNQAAATTITVDSGHNLEIGDTVYLLNRSGTDAYVTKVITATAATTITFVGAVDVNDNDVMGTVRVEIQRSENGGIDFFTVDNIPNNGRNNVSTQAYVDAIADGSLGDPIEDQAKPPEPPPDAAFCCIHQGLIVYAGFEDDPTGFAWNDPEWGLEAYPPATNRDQALGHTGGGVTGIVSESENSLAIFKARSYLRIQGDLASGQYTITEVGDNRLGISSHASIVKLENGVYGISEEGPVVVRDGTISLLPFAHGTANFFHGNKYSVPAAENTAIDSGDEDKLVPRRSTGAYWSEHNCIVFFIPAEEGTTNFIGASTAITRFANENSLWLCYDVETREWREWEVADSGINAHVAMHLHGGELYFISSNSYNGTGSTSPRNHVWKFLSGDSLYDYADNTEPIEFAPRLQWESLGSPSSDKKMTEIKIYARHATDFLSSFDLTINEYRNNDDATLYTQASRTFSASSDKEKVINAVLGNFVSNSIEFKNEELYECPVISGFEISYKPLSPPKIKDIKGD